MVTPTLDPKTNGRFGQIDVLAGPGRGALLPRFRPRQRGRQGGASCCRATGKEQADASHSAAAPNMPMTITFQVDNYMPAAIEKSIYVPVVLPKGQMDNGIGACRAEMTVNGRQRRSG